MDNTTLVKNDMPNSVIAESYKAIRTAILLSTAVVITPAISVLSAVEGLKVVQPSTAYDVKGLLKASIRDDNPVFFIEHK